MGVVATRRVDAPVAGAAVVDGVVDRSLRVRARRGRLRTGESLKTDWANEITPIKQRRHRAPRRRDARHAGRVKWGGEVVGCGVSWGGVEIREERGMAVAILANDRLGNPDTAELRTTCDSDCGKVMAWRHGSFCCAASTSGEPTAWRWPTSANV